TSFYSVQIIHLQEFNDLIEQLNLLFKQLAKIGRVPYVLLWENVAVRVVQFYHSFTNQNLNPDIQSRLEQQKQFFKSKAAESFYLTENPFVRLWNGWHPEFNTFMRQKCCFYFQLEEAEQTLCRNCPLRLKEIGKFKDESN
ncbi:(2Fe-2S)-binding protein, partial [Acinetobacter baumannii]